MNDPTVLAVPLLLAAVLVASGVGKLRSREDALAAFRALGVPRGLQRPAVARAHPWVEVALAAGVVLLPRPLSVVAAATALALMLVYTLLVVRALRAPEPVDCQCFGVLGEGTVTRVTVVRNGWLTLLAAGTLVVTVARPSSVLERLGQAGGVTWTWLALVAAAAVTVALVGPRGTAPAPPAAAHGADDDLEDYLRVRTPAVPVTRADGTTVTLRDLPEQRAQLLLHVSSMCGSCDDTLASVPAWRAQLPEIDVRLLSRDEPGSSRLTSLDEPLSLHDTNAWVAPSLGMTATPSAVLLGMDGMLAGGPVTGVVAIEEFVAEIIDQLREAREETEEATPGDPAPGDPEPAGSGRPAQG